MLTDGSMGGYKCNRLHSFVCFHALLNRMIFDLDLLHARVCVMTTDFLELKVKVRRQGQSSKACSCTTLPCPIYGRNLEYIEG